MGTVKEDSIVKKVEIALHGVAGEQLGQQKSAAQELLAREQAVLERAQQVIGSVEDAQHWIDHVNRSLGGVRPRTLLETEAGYRLVLDTLSRIAYGVYS